MQNELKKNVAAYVKVDETDEVLASLCEAAIEKCELETGKAFDDKSGFYCLAIKMLVAEWYDHRGQTTTETLKELPVTTNLQSILNQIAMSTEYAEVVK